MNFRLQALWRDEIVFQWTSVRYTRNFEITFGLTAPVSGWEGMDRGRLTHSDFPVPHFIAAHFVPGPACQGHGGLSFKDANAVVALSLNSLFRKPLVVANLYSYTHSGIFSGTFRIGSFLPSPLANSLAPLAAPFLRFL